MGKSIRLLVAPAIAAVALVGTTPAHAAAVVLDQGHVDVIGVAFEDGALDIHVHDEENDIEYAPADVRLVAKSGSRTTVPADPAYRFLGAAGAPVWVLPQEQDPNLLWPGVAAEEIEPGVFAGDTLRVQIVCVTGPGDFSIFTTDEVGAPTVLADSGNGLPDSFNLAAGQHLHANWAFEAAGRYTILVRVSGVLAATGQRVTDLEPYSFTVNR